MKGQKNYLVPFLLDFKKQCHMSYLGRDNIVLETWIKAKMNVVL